MSQTGEASPLYFPGKEVEANVWEEGFKAGRDFEIIPAVMDNPYRKKGNK